MCSICVPRTSLFLRHIDTDLLVIYLMVVQLWGCWLLLQRAWDILFLLVCFAGMITILERQFAFNNQFMIDLLYFFVEVCCASIQFSFKVLIVIGLKVVKNHVIVQVILAEVLVTLEVV